MQGQQWHRPHLATLRERELENEPREPRVRVETDFSGRVVRLLFPAEASDGDVEMWFDRIVATGLFVASGAS